jgi:polyisoprenyl-phosphate glycosyltransferase
LAQVLASKNITMLVTAVDDCSTDDTFNQLIQAKAASNFNTQIIKLVKNSGAQFAILAGLNNAIPADAYTILTADLQDPPELISQMADYWQQGMPIVIAHRLAYKDSISQGFISKQFHNLLQKTAFPNAPKGGFDLILFNSKVHKLLLDSNEKNTHIFYWIFSLGFPFAAIPYTRNKNQFGAKSQWTLSKKINLFTDSFTSFTNKPIRLITFLGFSIGVLFLVYGLFVLVNKLLGNIAVQGYTTTMLVLSFLGAFQLIAIGIIGEYVWRILEQVRNKPKYIIDKVIK